MSGFADVQMPFEVNLHIRTFAYLDIPNIKKSITFVLPVIPAGHFYLNAKAKQNSGSRWWQLGHGKY